MKSFNFLPMISMAIAGIMVAESGAMAGDFGEYWNRGSAEITSYELNQARYGAMHSGQAVLIFVTEPFAPKTQVKADQPTEESIPMLKLNLTKKFNTGIYPYSMMLSVFTPIDLQAQPHTLKTTVTSQEWCGHTFTQLNWRDGAYQAELRSYFESEGDRNFSAGDAMLEDEVWARLRLDPEKLPTGDFKMIPSGLYSRLSHRQQAPESAKATLGEAKADGRRVYTLEYPELKRTLRIEFEPTFPYKIERWEETAPDGFGANKPLLTTTATRKERMMVDYWNKNAPGDRPLRAKLGLPVE